MAIVIINSEILTQENSNPIFDWMENKKLEIFELVESLKKIEFLKAHSKVNNDLNSFHFPNDDYQRKRPQKEIKDELRLVNMIMPDLDHASQQLLLEQVDPLNYLVGLLIPPNKKETNQTLDNRGRAQFYQTSSK